MGDKPASLGAARTILVSQEFINRYLPLAEGLYVRVYLFLVGCLGEPDPDFEIRSVTGALGITERELDNAFRFWEQEKVLRVSLDGDSEISEIRILRDFTKTGGPVSDRNRFVTAEEGFPVSASGCRVTFALRQGGEKSGCSGTEAPVVLDMPEKIPRYSAKELNKFMENKEASILAHDVSRLLKRALQPQELRLVYCFYEKLRLSREVILYIFKDCLEKGKRAPEYIYKIGISWQGRKLETSEDAEAYNKFCHSGLAVAMNAFGLKRMPGKAELKYINKWNGYGLGRELIEEACSRTLLRLAKPDFAYADRIIENWVSKEVRTVADVQRLDLEHQERKNAGRKKQEAPKPESPKGSEGGYGKLDGSELEKILLGIRDDGAGRRAEA